MVLVIGNSAIEYILTKQWGVHNFLILASGNDFYSAGIMEITTKQIPVIKSKKQGRPFKYPFDSLGVTANNCIIVGLYTPQLERSINICIANYIIKAGNGDKVIETRQSTSEPPMLEIYRIA